jgi:lipopolysaccharide assembly outer membrane protein LptD (OstA)
MRPYFTAFLAALASMTIAISPLCAQVLPEWNVIAAKQEQLGENHGLLTGAVEIEQGDTKLYADQVEILDQEHMVATGNVVLTQANNRIAADRAVFNTKTKLGTFYSASGIASVQPPRQTAPVAGIVVPQRAGQETDVYFFGETVEKIGFRKYRITNGGFSSCVQPTPRWDLAAGTIILNVDHYTLLRNAVLNVKGVPMFYLPWMYYPTNDEERATGFLIPTYGMSSVRGQSISNEFFWAIDRSHDLALMHDWYSKTGQGVGAEYRYNEGGGSDGNLRAYTLQEQLGTNPEERSYTVIGNANHLLPGNFRAQARVNYFSSILTNQTLNVDVNNASRNTRNYGGNVLGTLHGFSVTGTFDRSEWFNDVVNSGVTGSTPRIAIAKNERPLFTGAPIYFSLGSEFVNLVRQTRANDVVTDDRSLTRFDLTPQVRYPFKKWSFFTVNSTASWRETYYSKSLDPGTGIVEDDNLNRRYYTVGTQLVGPVFTRVWDTPGNGYAEKFKHTIEPYMNIQRTSLINNFNQIVQIDGTDIVFGGTTSFAYGINNRFYAKRKLGQISQAQEIVDLEIRQTYYTDARATQYDTRYSTNTIGSAANNFSPVAISLRVTPTPAVNATVSAEIDSRYKELRTVSANTSYNWTNRVQTTGGWSHRFYIKDLAGFNDPRALDNYVNVSSNVHTLDNRFGGVYSFNYDVLRSSMLQTRISAFYNAQCCGIAFEYQRYNFAGLPSFIVPSDHRFFLSFTLAGLGNFSPFNGAMGGVPR